MWVQPIRWLVNRVIKSACLGAVLAGLDVLAAPIFGLDGVGVGLRVGPVPQPGWLGQGIFLTVTAVLSIPPSLHPSILPLREPARQVGRPLTIWVLSQQIPTPLLWPLLYAHISGWRLRRTRHPASWIKKRLSTHPNPFNYSFNSSWHVTPTAVRTLVFFSLYFCSQWPQGGWRRWLVTREVFTLVIFIFSCCDCMFVRSKFKASLVCKGRGWKPDERTTLYWQWHHNWGHLYITPAHCLLRGILYSSFRQI